MIAWAGIERVRAGSARRTRPLSPARAGRWIRRRRADARLGQEGGQGMIGIFGAGAFGTALAVALAQEGRQVRLWARDAGTGRGAAETRRNDTACRA